MGHTDLIALVGASGLMLSFAEWVVPEDANHPRTWRGRVGDLGFLSQYVIIVPLMGVGLTAGLSFVDGAVPLFSSWRFPVRLALGLIGVDVMMYWLHRFAHSNRLLWRLHSVHHSATEVGWATAFRFHVGGAAIDHTIPYLVVAALGVGIGAVRIVIAVQFVVAVFAHANIDVPFRRLQWFIATPQYHRTHHEVGEGHSNLAVMFPLLDRIFGTSNYERRESRVFGAGAVSG